MSTCLAFNIEYCIKTPFLPVISGAFSHIYSPHFIDKAQIKDLDVMWQFAAFVNIRVEVIAGKLFAIPTKFHALVLGAFISCTTMRVTENNFLHSPHTFSINTYNNYLLCISIHTL